MISRKMMLVTGALLASPANAATNYVDVVRDLAAQIGPIIGSASACDDIARRRIQAMSDKFNQALREATLNDADRTELTRSLEAFAAAGRKLVTMSQMDCKAAERQLAGLEKSMGTASLSPPPSSAPAASNLSSFGMSAAAAAPTQVGAIRGITDREIRFGMVMPFSGARKEAGRQMKLGIEAAFNRAMMPAGSMAGCFV